jgi:hypothetical protein
VEPKDEEQFTVFIDLLGFREFSAKVDPEGTAKRREVLDFLLSLSALRGEFKVEPLGQQNFKQIRPAVSTFSDHIVVSYPTRPFDPETGFDDRQTVSFIRMHFRQFLRGMAAAALRIGFLLRGGATIGPLYHSQGAVFGKALVDAYDIESRTSTYPRVVLSNNITCRPVWMDGQSEIVRCDDGLYHFDYFNSLALSSTAPGPEAAKNAKAWFDCAVRTIDKKLRDLEKNGEQKAFANWMWFARKYRQQLERENPKVLPGFEVDLGSIPWPR